MNRSEAEKRGMIDEPTPTNGGNFRVPFGKISTIVICVLACVGLFELLVPSKEVVEQTAANVSALSVRVDKISDKQDVDHDILVSLKSWADEQQRKSAGYTQPQPMNKQP